MGRLNNSQKKQKVTEQYFNTTEIYTYNTELKKRLTAYAATYPELYRLTEANSEGGLHFEIGKHRISTRLTAPYSEERKQSPVSTQTYRLFPAQGTGIKYDAGALLRTILFLQER